MGQGLHPSEWGAVWIQCAVVPPPRCSVCERRPSDRIDHGRMGGGEGLYPTCVDCSGTRIDYVGTAARLVDGRWLIDPYFANLHVAWERSTRADRAARPARQQ